MADWGDVFQRGLSNIGKGGLLPGMIQGYYESEAAATKKKTLQDAKTQLEELKAKQRAQREADLDRALTFFNPVDDYRRDFARTNAGYTGTPGYAPPRHGTPAATPQRLPSIPPTRDYFGSGVR